MGEIAFIYGDTTKALERSPLQTGNFRLSIFTSFSDLIKANGPFYSHLDHGGRVFIKSCMMNFNSNLASMSAATDQVVTTARILDWSTFLGR